MISYNSFYVILSRVYPLLPMGSVEQKMLRSPDLRVEVGWFGLLEL